MTPLPVSKADAAKVQLERAIRLYDEGDWICALTLACAAEGVLPPGTGPDVFSSIGPQATAKGRDPKMEKHSANVLCNWLKHSGDSQREHAPSIEIEPTNAALMIVRAITRFRAATGGQTPPMDAFERLFRERYPQFVGR
jgi:hypothetical protein